MQTISFDQFWFAGLAFLIIAAVVLRSVLTKKKIVAALNDGAIVVDVRSSSEFGSGHFSSAINIPHDKIGDSRTRLGSTDQVIILYCASGARSAVAAQTLRAKGYTKVINAGRLGAMP